MVWWLSLIICIWKVQGSTCVPEVRLSWLRASSVPVNQYFSKLISSRTTIAIQNMYLLILTYSMKQSPSWEANRFSASQEILRILWKPKFITAFTSARHLSLPWANSIQSMPPTSNFLKNHLNIIFPSTPGYSKWSLSLRFPHQNPVYASPLTILLHVPAISFSSWSPEQYTKHVRLPQILMSTFRTLVGMFRWSAGLIKPADQRNNLKFRSSYYCNLTRLDDNRESVFIFEE